MTETKRHISGNKMQTKRYNKPVTCEKCKEVLTYTGSGRYICKKCGHRMLDDYGKVKEFVDETGIALMDEIAEATGVEREVIEELIKEGLISSTEEEGGQLRCLGCGRVITQGRYCIDCSRKFATGLSGAFAGEPVEKKKEDPPERPKARMHITRRRRR